MTVSFDAYNRVMQANLVEIKVGILDLHVG